MVNCCCILNGFHFVLFPSNPNANEHTEEFLGHLESLHPFLVQSLTALPDTGQMKQDVTRGDFQFLRNYDPIQDILLHSQIAAKAQQQGSMAA